MSGSEYEREQTRLDEESDVKKGSLWWKDGPYNCYLLLGAMLDYIKFKASRDGQ